MNYFFLNMVIDGQYSLVYVQLSSGQLLCLFETVHTFTLQTLSFFKKEEYLTGGATGIEAHVKPVWFLLERGTSK